MNEKLKLTEQEVSNLIKQFTNLEKQTRGKRDLNDLINYRLETLYTIKDTLDYVLGNNNDLEQTIIDFKTCLKEDSQASEN